MWMEFLTLFTLWQLKFPNLGLWYDGNELHRNWRLLVLGTWAIGQWLLIASEARGQEFGDFEGTDETSYQPRCITGIDKQPWVY